MKVKFTTEKKEKDFPHIPTCFINEDGVIKTYDDFFNDGASVSGIGNIRYHNELDSIQKMPRNKKQEMKKWILENKEIRAFDLNKLLTDNNVATQDDPGRLSLIEGDSITIFDNGSTPIKEIEVNSFQESDYYNMCINYILLYFKYQKLEETINEIQNNLQRGLKSLKEIGKK